jgi:uncharacterized protein (TIGR00304 family)
MAISGWLGILGTALIVAGIVLLAIAVAVFARGAKGKGESKMAGVIVIGPVPIIFGSKKNVKMLLALSVALTALLLALLLLYFFLFR